MKSPGCFFSKKIDFLLSFLLTFLQIYRTLLAIRRWVEQLAARRAHNPEAAGSSPAPANEGIQKGAFFFYKSKSPGKTRDCVDNPMQNR